MKSEHDDNGEKNVLEDQITKCELSLREAGRTVSSRDERIWAAGFFDGEGYVAALSEGVTCEIDQIEEDLINLVRFRNAVGVGKIVALKPRSNENARPACRWRISNQTDLQTVYNAIGEFLNPAKKNGRRVQTKNVPDTPGDGFARALAAPYRAILTRLHPKLPPDAIAYEPISNRQDLEEQ